MARTNHSMSLAGDKFNNSDPVIIASIILGSTGLVMLLISLQGFVIKQSIWQLFTSLTFIGIGTFIFAWRKYMFLPAGIKNNGVWLKGLSSRGLSAWVLGFFLTGFYIVLYFFPEYLGLAEAQNRGLVSLFDPLSMAIKGQPASQWFVYGVLYTIAIFIFGIKFILKYRHNRYQVIRTISVMFFQTGFAFLIPEILERLNTSTYTSWFDKDMKNMWPLDYDFFHDWHIDNMIQGGNIGLVMMILGIAMIFIISPILTYLYGKRWYCSWVCGCGGLAETAGDPFRHLSSSSLRSWKIERWMIHSVLVFVIIMTLMVLYTRFSGNSRILFLDSYQLQKWYGFYIGAIFSGVVGVGFYPIMGTRVWCRYGCPMAAILGIQQKFFSRFRITTNGGQCISCGNCTTYCEMGIDVRHYAQRGQNIVRASCVGCGICAAVCPRGVLKLENGSIDISERSSEVRNEKFLIN